MWILRVSNDLMTYNQFCDKSEKTSQCRKKDVNIPMTLLMQTEEKFSFGAVEDK